MLGGTEELFGVAFGPLAVSSLTCFSNSAIRASNCEKADNTNALTAGVISASISGGIVINGGRVHSGMHLLMPNHTLYVEISFFLQSSP